MTTRHNFGFLLLDEISAYLTEEKRLSPTSHGRVDGFARWECFEWDERALTLFWPLTYMNLSGEAVSAWIEKHLSGTSFEATSDMMVAFDDLSLPLGRVRIRSKGSSGGHNGLKSMEACLGHSDYPRLKLGIGRPDEASAVVDYVLHPFNAEEVETVGQVLNFCVGPMLDWASGQSFDRLAQSVNGWKAPGEEKEISPKADM